MPASIGGAGRHFLFLLDQSLRQRDQFFPISPVAQGKKAFQKSQTDRRPLIGIQKGKLWRHREAIHYRYPGFEAVNQPSLDKIIEQLQFCIVDAKALQLKMLERILSIALLEAYESKQKSRDGRGGGAP